MIDKSEANVLADYLTKDGLVKTSNLILGSYDWTKAKHELGNNLGSIAFQLKPLIKKNNNLWFYPSVESRSVIDYLIQHENLFKLAAIRLGSQYISRKGALIIGLDFERALNIALTEGFQKSIFYALDHDTIENWGVVAYFVIHLKFNKKENLIELEAWQGFDKDPTVYYIHATFPQNLSYCKHLDGATIVLSPEDLESLFRLGEKRKGKKEKHFRLDDDAEIGEIRISFFLEIMQKYFLVDELLKEYFNTSNTFFEVVGERKDKSLKRFQIALSK